MSAEQRTLSGDEANCGRVRPQTLVRCHKCDDHILRRQRFDHEHDVYVSPWHRSVYEYAQAEVVGR